MVQVAGGNNGGDGLVAARHLHHFGYAVSVPSPVPLIRLPRAAVHDAAPVTEERLSAISVHHLQVCYPKPTDKPLFNGLVTQCQQLHIPFLSVGFLAQEDLAKRFDVIVDALFGFSFKSTPRPPFDSILKQVHGTSPECMLVSVDIPSGWHVEEGPPREGALQPHVLVSLTAPKEGCRDFSVRFQCGF